MNLFCLPPADQAFAFEEVAKNVTDESQVQKHSDSINKHTEAASRLCHCSDEMRCLAGNENVLQMQLLVLLLVILTGQINLSTTCIGNDLHTTPTFPQCSSTSWFWISLCSSAIFLIIVFYYSNTNSLNLKRHSSRMIIQSPLKQLHFRLAHICSRKSFRMFVSCTNVAKEQEKKSTQEVITFTNEKHNKTFISMNDLKIEN